MDNGIIDVNDIVSCGSKFKFTVNVQRFYGQIWNFTNSWRYVITNVNLYVQEWIDQLIAGSQDNGMKITKINLGL